MRAADRTAYIVACIREAGAMYPQDAAQFLADHDAERRAEVLAEAAAMAERFTEQWPDMDAMKADGIIGPFTAVGRLADQLREMAGKDTGGAVQAPAGESTQPASFFQPDHSYARRDGTTFQCFTVTTTPWNGRPLAVGWHTAADDITSIAWRGIDEWRHEYDGVQPPETAVGGDA